MRITDVFGTSGGVRCFRHSGKRTLAIAEWKLPSRAALAAWALNAAVPDEEPRARTSREHLEEHLAQLRSLRVASLRPGRTRRELIVEAEADEQA